VASSLWVDITTPLLLEFFFGLKRAAKADFQGDENIAPGAI